MSGWLRTGSSTSLPGSGSTTSKMLKRPSRTSSALIRRTDCSGTDIELDGSASFDPDGDEHSYLWTESTGSVTFSNRYSSITDLVLPDQPAEYGVSNTVVYEISLEVADCEQSDTDTLNVTFECTGERP